MGWFISVQGLDREQTRDKKKAPDINQGLNFLLYNSLALN